MNICSGKAIWKTKDYDLIVEIVRYLGTVCGVKYYLVRSDNGETGVPETELFQDERVLNESNVGNSCPGV